MQIRKPLTVVAWRRCSWPFPCRRRRSPVALGTGRTDCDDVSAAGIGRRGLEILSNYYPGYWWDHTALTIAVQAHPSATAEQLDAIVDAIATWSATLRTASTA